MGASISSEDGIRVSERGGRGDIARNVPVAQFHGRTGLVNSATTLGGAATIGGTLGADASGDNPTVVYVRSNLDENKKTSSGVAWLEGQARYTMPEVLDRTVEPRNQNVTTYEWGQFADKVGPVT